MNRRGAARRIGAALAAVATLPGRPGLRAQTTSDGTASSWRFEPARDSFSREALLDLRSLNEEVAGATGFVRVGSDGDFVRGDGAPLRFWAVNTDVGRRPFVATPLGAKSAPDLGRHARFLAKRGVNMVRLHRQLSPDLRAQPNAAITDIDEVERDGIWRTVAAMRRQGIYTTISPYWAASMRFSKAWGVTGGAEQPAWGLLFFDATLQAAYRAWLGKLLTEKNPYTGIALAQDASVAIIQLQNEDSLLFWTVDAIKGAQREALEALYAGFLVRKHGSLTNALAAWQGDRTPGDAPDAARMALLAQGQLKQPGAGGRAARLADQTEFYARTMLDFNRRTVEHLRSELGVRQLINAGNWRTVDAARLNDAERWSYTPGDVDATNAYTGGLHQGPARGWAVLNGDKFTSESVLRHPQALPINLKQTTGRPMLVTEGAWVMPNGFGAEGPFLIAAYASLTGVGGYYWFTTHDEGWAPPQSANGHLPSQQKWSFADPDTLGTFPAAALAYRSGYLQRGAPAVVENRPLQALWDRKLPLLTEASNFDPNRDAARAAPGAAGAVTPAAFLVGPVRVTFAAESARAPVIALEGMVEPGLIRSDTGQIVMNTAEAHCRIDAPMVQGVAAHFAQAPVHQLSDVRFASANAFGAALAVSLDGLPLQRSKRVLVQYGTQSRPTGWSQAPAAIVASPGQAPVSGVEVKSFGQAPWQVQRALLDVAIRNPALSRATALDMNGMPGDTLPLKRSATQVEFRFPETAMYVLLR